MNMLFNALGEVQGPCVRVFLRRVYVPSEVSIDVCVAHRSRGAKERRCSAQDRGVDQENQESDYHTDTMDLCDFRRRASFFSMLGTTDTPRNRDGIKAIKQVWAPATWCTRCNLWSRFKDNGGTTPMEAVSFIESTLKPKKKKIDLFQGFEGPFQ
jgi:hypothetical protein